MHAHQVVELTFGDSSAGSGYLITSRHVLTAKHVVVPTRVGEKCTVQALTDSGAFSLPLSKGQRPKPYGGHSAWISQSHDIAIVALDTDIGSITPITIGLVPRDEFNSYPCSGIGFPEAARDESYYFDAELTWVPEAQRFNLSVRGPLPKQWKKWAGLSGCVIFSGGFPVGIIRTVDGNWDGLLKATPIEHLLEDAGFKSYWQNAGFEALSTRYIAKANASLLSQISAQIYRIDRKNTSAQVTDLLGESLSLRKPQKPHVIAIPGLDEDEHRHLILMLSQDNGVQKQLGRMASGDNVIVQLPWPAEETNIRPDEWFDNIMGQFSRSVRVPLELNHTFDLATLRHRLDQTVTPSAYWLLVRRAIAFQGHGELLRRFLEFWHSIPEGRPVWLFLCLAWDEPTEKRSSLLAILNQRRPIPGENLEPILVEATERKQVTGIEELGIITGDHIGQWITELRAVCRAPSPEQFDGLHVSLLGRIGAGKRLRRVAADIGAVLPNI